MKSAFGQALISPTSTRQQERARSAPALRSQSARLLTDLLAADVSALEDTLTYLSARPAPAVDYVTAETAKAKGGVCLTDAGMAAVRDLLS